MRNLDRYWHSQIQGHGQGQEEVKGNIEVCFKVFIVVNINCSKFTPTFSLFALLSIKNKNKLHSPGEIFLSIQNQDCIKPKIAKNVADL